MAFTTVQGANRAAGNPFVVRRKCVNAGLFERPGAAVSESLFMADLMGVGADLRRALRHGPRRDDVAFGA